MNGLTITNQGNAATIWITSDSHKLQILIQGPSPSLLLLEIRKLLDDTKYNYPGMRLQLSFLCPKCLIEVIKASHAKIDGIPEEVGVFPEKEVKSIGEEAICTNKHRVKTQYIIQGLSEQQNKSNELVQKCQKVIAGIKRFGKKLIREVPRDYWIDNLDIIKFLSLHWLEFAERFPRISSQTSDILYQNIAFTSKAVLVMKAIFEETEGISADYFVKTLEEIVDLHLQLHIAESESSSPTKLFKPKSESKGTIGNKTAPTNA